VGNTLFINPIMCIGIGGLLGPPQAVFVQVASPSRDRVNQYQQLLLDVEALVGRINGEHAILSQPALR
jgi:trehalose 6-phosphate synthase